MDTKPLILIVDDEAVIINILVSILKKNYQLGIAKNGIKALEYVEKSKPDLIFLDMQMPEMDGYEVCSRLKKNEQTKNIPIVFLSGMKIDKENPIVKDFDMVDFIYKPFNALEILERIKKYIP